MINAYTFFTKYAPYFITQPEDIHLILLLLRFYAFVR